MNIRFLHAPRRLLSRHGLLRIAAVTVAAGVIGAAVTACDSAGGGASGCGDAAPASDAHSGVPDRLNVGVANNVAMAAPLTRLDSVGITDTSLTTASTPEELRTNFITGRYDVAAMPINIAANLCAQGIDLALVGAVSGNIVHLMGPAGTTLESLRGQTVHVPFENDVVDLVTRQLLGAAGLTYEGENPDVTLAYHPTPLEIATGLADGSMQYAVLPEHLSTVVSQTAPSTVKAASLQDLWVEHTGSATLPFAGFVVRGELVRQYPDLVGALQSSFVTSVMGVVSDPAAGARAIAERVPVPEDVVAKVLPGLRPTYLPAKDTRPDVERLYGSLLDTVPESVGGSVPPDGFYLGSTAA